MQKRLIFLCLINGPQIKKHLKICLSVFKKEIYLFQLELQKNKHNVSEYFNTLYQVYEQYNFGGQDIWNIDETGATTLQHTDKFIFVRR